MAQNNTLKARSKAVEDTLDTMLEWYIVNNRGQGPDHVREYYHPIDKYTIRWFEPQLPYLDNPVLIEQQLGDHWSLRIEKANQSVKVPT